MQKIWIKKPNDHCQSQQLCCDKYPRAGHSWSLKTQTSKPEPPLIPCKKIEKKKNADKIAINHWWYTIKVWSNWASNTKLPFEETNQPFCDKLITLHSFTVGTPDCIRSYSHFKESIISFLFQQGQCFLTGSLRVILWGTTVCMFLERRDLWIIFKKRGVLEKNIIEWENSAHPKDSEESADSRFSETLSQKYSPDITKPHISLIRAQGGMPDFPRLSIQPLLELNYNYVLDLMLGFFCNTLKNKRTLVTAEGTSWILYIDIQFSSVQFSRSVMRPHGLQHARLPCPSPAPRACSNSCPLNQWYHATILSSAVPFFSCLQSFPASGSFPMSVLHVRWPKY